MDLPPVERAATIVHRGPMETWCRPSRPWPVGSTANGYRSSGYPREINLECPENRDEWVTELQEPITAG